MLLGSFLLALRGQNKKIYFVIILTLIIFLTLTPPIIEETPRFRYAYKSYGFADYIIRNDHIDPKVVWYHNWPGAFFSMSMLSKIINPENDLLFLMYFSFIIQIIYFFPVYTFLQLLFQDDDKKIWIGIWIFYILNFINQDYMSPQAFAYLYFLIILSVTVKLAKIGKNYDGMLNNISYKFVGVILISGIAITHMMTSTLVLSIIFFSALFSSSSSSKKILYKFTFLFIIIITAWVIYGAYVYLNWHLVDFIEKAYNLDSMFSQNLQRVSGSPSHLIISKLMIFTTFISIIFAALGITFSYFRKDKITSINTRILVMAGAILAIAPQSPYGGEMMMRIFLFMLPLLSFFIAQIFINSNLKIILILFLIIMSPLNVITHYGNEEYDYVSKAELKSYDFFYEKAANRNITGGYPIADYKFVEKFEFVDLKDLKWDGNEYTTKTGSKNNIMISRGDIEKFKIFANNEIYIEYIKNSFTNNKNYILVYSNGDAALYENAANIISKTSDQGNQFV